jgi:hypothetical protein
MASITVKLKDGTIATYVKPSHCLISDEDWEHSLGYCWGFASRQDEGIPQCKAWNENGGCIL